MFVLMSSTFADDLFGATATAAAAAATLQCAFLLSHRLCRVLCQAYGGYFCRVLFFFFFFFVVFRGALLACNQAQQVIVVFASFDSRTRTYARASFVYPTADESHAPSPVYAGSNAGLSAGQRSLDTSMEAGDEEIDWDHTRMLSLGFFPSISTDEVCVLGFGLLVAVVVAFVVVLLVVAACLWWWWSGGVLLDQFRFLLSSTSVDPTDTDAVRGEKLKRYPK